MAASYRFGVEWIALNDEPGEMDSEVVSGLISTCLLADLFGKDQEKVAADIIQFRVKNARVS